MAQERTPQELTDLDDLLQRILTGQATAEDRARFDTISGEPVKSRDWSAMVIRSLDTLDVPLKFDANQFRTAIRARIAPDAPRHARRTSRLPWNHTRLGVWLSCMMAVVVIGGGAVMFGHQTRVPGPHSASKLYTTGPGVFATVALPDGGHIVLAPQTQLTLTTDAQRRTQRASLAGEARFDIVPRPDAAFIVQTGQVETRVLGTTFEVRRYPGDSTGRVMVHSGRVSTQGQGAAITLGAGMAATFTDAFVASAELPPSVAIDWTRHELVFRNVQVPTLLRTLERTYGTTFLLTDSSLAARHVVATFPAGRTADMLLYLRRLLNVTMAFDGSIITLCSSTQTHCAAADSAVGTAAPTRASSSIHTLRLRP